MNVKNRGLVETILRVSLLYLKLRRYSMPTSARAFSAWADEQETSRGNYCALIFPEK